MSNELPLHTPDIPQPQEPSPTCPHSSSTSDRALSSSSDTYKDTMPPALQSSFHDFPAGNKPASSHETTSDSSNARPQDASSHAEQVQYDEQENNYRFNCSLALLTFSILALLATIIGFGFYHPSPSQYFLGVVLILVGSWHMFVMRLARTPECFYRAAWLGMIWCAEVAGVVWVGVVFLGNGGGTAAAQGAAGNSTATAIANTTANITATQRALGGNSTTPSLVPRFF